MSGQHPSSELIRLMRAASVPPEQAVRRLLVLACQLLDMDVAYLTRLDRRLPVPSRTVVLAVTREGQDVEDAAGLTEPLEASWCGPVVARGAFLVSDVAAHAALAALPTTAAFGIVSHAGVTVRSGPGDSGPGDEVVGTLCVLGRTPHPSLNPRDEALLRDIATVIGPLVATPGPAAVPAQRTPEEARHAALTGAADLEGLTRSILETMHELTQLGSTYLTVLHEETGQQEIRYSLNTVPGFTLPEGLHVPWSDTLCRRALEEGRVCTADVPGVWGDSAAARELGIQTYVSVPVELADGRVWGTLCAADSRTGDDLAAHVPTLRLFSRLIAAEVERSVEVSRSVRSAERARVLADTDPLTGCAQRRLVMPWLLEALRSAPAGHEVVVAFVDVDDFKTVNDSHGHHGGDTVLADVAARLRAALRGVDLLARYGGDEFLAAAVLPQRAVPELRRRLGTLERSVVTVNGSQHRVGLSVGIAHRQGLAHPTTEDVERLVQQADDAMYAAKRLRRTGSPRT